jgi:protein-S-isoprenylcysteine O-methyltransferase Ste14
MLIALMSRIIIITGYFNDIVSRSRSEVITVVIRTSGLGSPGSQVRMHGKLTAEKDRFIRSPADYAVPMEKKFAFAFFYILLFPVLLFLLAGDWDWREGWVFTIWFLVLCYTVIVYLYRKDPELLAERYQKPGTGNQEPRDIAVVIGIMVGFMVWIAIMPLDARRFHWSPPFPLWLQFAGVVMLALSFFFFFRSYIDNTYLSPLVRIQKERRQTVVSTGVYALVRHPMYLGGILMFLGTPLLLGSAGGIVAGLALTLLLMVRIPIEEALLLRELEGYGDYCQKVRFRLFPFIW